MKKAIVVCGFPGVGKSHAEMAKKGILDAESSCFHWVYDYDDPENVKKKDPAFPGNYIEYIKEEAGKCCNDFILVATHGEVRKALREAGIKYINVAPEYSCRNEYMKRYVQRGSDMEFIESLYNNWDRWINEIETEGTDLGIPTVWLKEGEYISDVIIPEYWR